MQNIELDNELQIQRKKVFQDFQEVSLYRPCRINEGVLQFQEDEKVFYIQQFNRSEDQITFFIPASGSGSRMFQFLHEFLSNPNESVRGQVERFLRHIQEFAFYQKIPLQIREELENNTLSLDKFVHYLLYSNGLNFSNLPKGMVPFHRIGPFVLNPFQEQILQAKMIKGKNFSFHYTINKKHEEDIVEQIQLIEQFLRENMEVSYSYQDEKTDSYTFDRNGDICLDELGNPIKRPAGHGALLQNLEKISSDYIFIKNIDNIQHYMKSDLSVETWKFLGGLAMSFKEDSKEVFSHPSTLGLKKLNEKYQFLDPQLVATLSESEIVEVLNRPFRVCGMVKNEGQPGGGPFWINRNGKISKQIIEKSQISMNGEQNKILVQSTHFNPVMIVAHTRNFCGKTFNLSEYKDDNQFFVVDKGYQGRVLKFAELPGLWNGSMAEWNSLFVEVPSETFSPVKTVLDLLDYAHKE